MVLAKGSAERAEGMEEKNDRGNWEKWLRYRHILLSFQHLPHSITLVCLAVILLLLLLMPLPCFLLSLKMSEPKRSSLIQAIATSSQHCQSRYACSWHWFPHPIEVIRVRNGYPWVGFSTLIPTRWVYPPGGYPLGLPRTQSRASYIYTFLKYYFKEYIAYAYPIL